MSTTTEIYRLPLPYVIKGLILDYVQGDMGHRMGLVMSELEKKAERNIVHVVVYSHLDDGPHTYMGVYHWWRQEGEVYMERGDDAVGDQNLAGWHHRQVYRDDMDVPQMEYLTDNGDYDHHIIMYRGRTEPEWECDALPEFPMQFLRVDMQGDPDVDTIRNVYVHALRTIA